MCKYRIQDKKLKVPGQFQLLNRLSETYYELESSKEDTPIRNRIFEQVKAEILK